MDLDSVRQLKAELGSEAAPRALGRERMRAHAAHAARRTSDIDPLPRTLALGVTRRGRRDYRLAVRIQRRSIESSPGVEAIRRRARGEVDIRYVGRLTKRSVPPYRRRQRPLRIGVSLGHHRITAGTLGAFVTRRGTGEVRILSNNHVLADENRGKAGDAILQPGAYDGGRPQDRVGALGEVVRLWRRRTNRVDAALATIDDGVEHAGGLLSGHGRLKGVASDPVDIADELEKLGRTTGHTRGRVTAFELDNVVVGYDMGNIRFDDQIEIEGAGRGPFSDGGDSGSLIYTASGHLAVALLFAGGDVGGRNGAGLTYANPIGLVLDRLKADLLL